jgi:hypothetical protein
MWNSPHLHVSYEININKVSKINKKKCIKVNTIKKIIIKNINENRTNDQ